MSGVTSSFGRAQRVAACAFFVYHLAAITVSNLPRSTALGGMVHVPFSGYLTWASLWQTWDMFTTIPRFLDLSGTLVALDDRGEVTRYGAVLPGLSRDRGSPRIRGIFIRLAYTGQNYPGYSDRYLAAVCRAIRARTGRSPESVGFELRVKELRALADIRRDGRIAEGRTLTFGPARCAP